MVAPYESDAQLALLSKEGIVDVVISEDSDLLVYGKDQTFFILFTPCQQYQFLSSLHIVSLTLPHILPLLLGAKRVFYKLDLNGWGEEIIRRDLGANQDLNFYNWNNDMFILFCCLSGCDYLEKVGKMRMGMKTAHKYVSKYRGYTRLAEGIRAAYPSDESFDVEEFLRRLYMSLMTFKHQTVRLTLPKHSRLHTLF